MYKSRIDSRTTVSYVNGALTITQEEDNWGSARPSVSSSITIADLSRLKEAIADIQEMKRNEW